MKGLASLILLCISFISYSQISEHYQNRISDLSEKIKLNPSNLALYYSRADVYDALEKFEQANRDYLKVVELYHKNYDKKFSGEFVKSCYRLADEYFFRQADEANAKHYIDEGLKESPGYKDLQILDAILTGINPNLSEAALEKYQSAVQQYPNDIRLNLYYGKFLQPLRPLDAAARYDKALAADPLNREALLSAGTIYNNEATQLSGMGKEPERVFEYAKKAAVYFERLYKINPENKEVTNILIRLYEELDQQEKADLLKKPY